MTDYSKHSDALTKLTKSQDADSDNRDACREAHLFIDKKDGQWEPYWWEQNSGKPRYTFDMTSGQVDQTAGEMEQADFDIVIKPAGGDTTKDDAKLLDGMIRNIENISNAHDIYNLAGRSMVTGGIDGWQIKHVYVDDDSFYQDLIVAPIANFVDSVWFGPFKLPDASDAPYCFVLEAIDKDLYEEDYPEGSGQSVSQDQISEAYFNKADQIIIGQFYYIEKVPRELLLMKSGRILEDNEDNRQILDELAASGDTVEKTRTRHKDVVYSRLFDGGDWLGEPQKTVFNQLPVVPTIGNFKIFENKLLYWGLVQKLIDAQRVYNYSKSREIEEGALAPREKIWMTTEQSAGHEATLATLNTNTDPVQFYNPDPKAPGIPGKTNGATINPGLNTLSTDMTTIMQQVGGMFDANRGNNPGLQSGIAIERLQQKGDTSTIKYFASQERAIRRTAKILIDAIPVVYDTPRQVRILKEDGSFDVTQINQVVMDQQSGRPVTVNDVSKGKYDVACSAGPAFQNRQQETVTAITEMAAIDPTVIEQGGDILFSNIVSPGMDLLAERKRAMIYQAGGIPFEQQTDEEKQQTQQAQAEPPPPDPMMIAAQAEADKAQAQNQKVMVEAENLRRKADRDDFMAQQKTQGQQFDQMYKMMTGAAQEVNTQADTLKKISEALGIETMQTPGALTALTGQIGQVIESQQDD